MKDFLRRVKADFLLSSILCIILGLVFIIYREATVNALGMLIAIGMIVVGLIYLGSFFLHFVTNGFSATIGAIILVIGVWILIQPAIVVSLIPIVIGVVLTAHGIRALRESIASKEYGYESWGVGAGLAVISIVLGIFCIINAFGIVKMASVLIGVALIYNGVSNIYVAITGTKAEKTYRANQEPIDIEFKED